MLIPICPLIVVLFPSATEVFQTYLDLHKMHLKVALTFLRVLTASENIQRYFDKDLYLKKKHLQPTLSSERGGHTSVTEDAFEHYVIAVTHHVQTYEHAECM